MNSMPHPVILVEGLDGVGKSTLVNTIATKLHASIIASPPKIPDPLNQHRDLRTRMDQRKTSVRREFYRSGNFHASLLIEEARKHGPVVLDRYWPSTASFAVLDDYQPQWEPLGVWPRGLVEPDIIILLTVNEDNRLKRMTKRGLISTEEEARLEKRSQIRAEVIEALRCFEPIEIDTSHLNTDEVFSEVIFWLKQAGILSSIGSNQSDITAHKDSSANAFEEKGV